MSAPTARSSHIWGRPRKPRCTPINLDAVADRGYFKGEEILACEKAGITVTLPKPQTSGAKSEGRFGKPDFVYLPADDVYRCPAGEKLTYRYPAEEDGQNLRRYWTSVCPICPIQGINARKARSGASPAGNTSTSSRPCRHASTKIRNRCVCAARRSSIRSPR